MDVSDTAGAPLGTLEVTKYFNARVTLSLRDVGGQQLAVLEPEGKTDKGFALHDGAGTSLGRVVAARSERKLLAQDRTWWVPLARPLPQPLDALALGAAVALNNIQLLVVNLADHRDVRCRVARWSGDRLGTALAALLVLFCAGPAQAVAKTVSFDDLPAAPRSTRSTRPRTACSSRGRRKAPSPRRRRWPKRIRQVRWPRSRRSGNRSTRTPSGG